MPATHRPKSAPAPVAPARPAPAPKPAGSDATRRPSLNFPLPPPLKLLSSNPYTPAVLTAVMGAVWIARGAWILGPVRSPLAMFVFGFLDVLLCVALAVGIPPARRFAVFVYPVQALVALGLSGSVAFALLGVLAPLALLASMWARHSAGRFVGYAGAAASLFLVVVAGAAVAVGPAGEEPLVDDAVAPARRSDTGFGIKFTAPPGFENLDEGDALSKLFAVPMPAPHRVVLPFRSDDRTLGGFVSVDRVAMHLGVPARNFTRRVVDDLAEVRPDTPKPERVTVAVPARLGRLERVAESFWITVHRPELRGVIVSLKTPDGRVVSVVVVGPSAVFERTRKSAELVCGGIDLEGLGAR